MVTENFERTALSFFVNNVCMSKAYLKFIQSIKWLVTQFSAAV